MDRVIRRLGSWVLAPRFIGEGRIYPYVRALVSRPTRNCNGRTFAHVSKPSRGSWIPEENFRFRFPDIGFLLLRDDSRTGRHDEFFQRIVDTVFAGELIAREKMRGRVAEIWSEEIADTSRDESLDYVSW